MPSGAPVTKSRNRVAYEAHVANVRAIQKAIVVAERAHKRAIRVGLADEEALLLLMLSTLSGIWCENVLRRLVYTKGVLNDATRRKILRTDGGYATKQRDRWTTAVDQTLFARYGVSKPSALRQYVQVWRRRLLDAVETNVVPVIEERNRFAHGGWAVALDGDVPHLAPAPVTDGYIALRRRRELIQAASDLVLDILQTTRANEDALRVRMKSGIARLQARQAELVVHDPSVQRRDIRKRARQT